MIETTDYDLDGLDNFLSRFLGDNPPVREYSLIIWNFLLEHLNTTSHYSFYEAEYRWFYCHERSASFEATWKKRLRSREWMPKNGNDTPHRPEELSLSDLPDQFDRSEKLADILGMRKTEKLKAADVLSEGNPRKKELLERIANASDDELERFEKLVPRTIPPTPAPSFKEGLANMSRRQHGNFSSKPDYSEGEQDHPVRNPERYQNNLDDAVTDGVEEHTTIPHTVQFSPVRDKPDNKEAREFLYVEYHGQCQIKGTTFRKAAANSEGIPENYFEACSLLPYSNACYLNDAGNMLCVSADTMAKLKYASFEWLDDIKDIIDEFEDGGGKAQRIGIKIKLAGEECVITWSQRHFMRLISLYRQA